MAAIAEYSERLKEAAQRLGLCLDPAQREKLLVFLKQLERWNRVYNLTAIRDPEQMLVQHIFDSLAVIPTLDNILDKNTVLDPIVVDVGSGGGLPGIVLAITRPWTVHCVDAVEKKMAFVQQMRGALSLSNLHAHHARVEELSPFQADIVLSRAFASLADFSRLAGKHVTAAGSLVAMKGRKPHDEISALNKIGWCVDDVVPLSVPELDAQRCVLRLSRQGTV